MKAKRKLFLLLTCAVLCISLTSCSVVESFQGPKATERPHVTATPEPALNVEPADLYEGVMTDWPVISMVFEGYTDTDTMSEILDILEREGIRSTFFITGQTADDHPDVVQQILARGHGVGNYGVSATPEMEKKDVNRNVHNLQRTQELIQKACGVTPVLCCLNRTDYTRQVLQACRVAGVSAVKPDAWINHRSFQKQEDADAFVATLIRGSILSVKLGQELVLSEYGDRGERLDVRPAIDPTPSIRENWQEEAEPIYQNVVKVLEYVLTSLRSVGFSVVDLDSLRRLEVTFSDTEYAVEPALTGLLDASYDLTQTAQPLSVSTFHEASGAEMEGTVFVGDAIMANLESYVDWQRESGNFPLGEARFLTARNMTVEQALQPVSSSSFHPTLSTTDAEGNVTRTKMSVEDALLQMDARHVVLMLKFSNQRAYSDARYLRNLQLLIYRIRKINPDIRVSILSLTPHINNGTTPANNQTFRLNLELCRFCAQYGFGFIDGAWALRDENGDLKTEYCLDVNMTGSHLNDQGCAALSKMILSHWPD